MKPQPFYRILTLVILLALTVSCSPQATPSLPAVTGTESPSTATPVPLPTQTARPTKAPGAQGQGQGQGSDASQSLSFEIPNHSFDVILGRPTDTSITLSFLAYSDQTVAVSYGTQSTALETEAIKLKANQPTEIILANLTPDTSYLYTLNNGEQFTFHTARAPGESFTFTIQADSHLDSNTDPLVYEQTLANQRADHPDFVIDMGDTFMTDKYKPYADAAPQYLAQRYFMGQLGMPLYLVLGNHDGEGAPRGKDGVEMSFWSAQLRTSLFPNPVPDGFYTGNTIPDKTIGALQDYYAWEWGDALFVVLDPYWFTSSAPNSTDELWNSTLGETQYRWLKTTLETSDAQWKFVFIHQLIGGYDKNGRGGVEVAPFYEWGGNNADGSYGFDEQRPNWGMPIHQLLVANNVSAVFHGHDHLFVKQELDGIIYQECPQPGAARANGTDSAAEYSYLSGDVLGSPGHIRVKVAPDSVKVEYVRTEGGAVGYSYTISP